ncbi:MULTISPECIES: alpha/beta hydrolase fold domain-containing protein [Atopobiaceae]|uniref:Acetyl esterase/lipase n=1 Tax=Parafannyhessea umbonata TaxID=604330 RepID=A0A1H9PHJ4_9ACTN|nr:MULTISPECIES: alpha/beta hydrolase [Atopobiaceae]SEH50672.1 Acetyl esterase/lipase [Parafannyhessea umbonata]SER47746.1 Acetyl esterase/lipase [Parafannyhessea umbonata]SJZ76587.1 Acetyl esterase/lipase [Olsenella sp. KH1P3]
MKKSTKAILATTGATLGAAVAGAGFELWSRTRFGRSGIATAAEGVWRLSGVRRNTLGRDLGRYDDFVEKNRAVNEQEYHLPGWMGMKSVVFEETRDGMKTFHVGTTGKNKHAILYLHGGAYVQQISPFHWQMIDKLCVETEAEVVVPIYPLAPAHDYDEAYSLLTDLYEGMCDRYGADAITIMGDSAGAGLAAGMAETFSHYKLEQPAHLVLISPIVDLSMRNPDIHDFFDRDPMLAPWGLAQLGDLWADGDDICDPRLSPIYGDVSDLKNVTIFTGTREIFYPDAIKFAEKLKDAGVTCDLRVGQGMNHDWPLYPIPEAKEAISQMVQVVVA